MTAFKLNLTANDTLKAPEQQYAFELQITNVSNESKSGTISFQPPLHVKPFRYFEVEINALQPGASKEISLHYEFTYGGRHVFYFWEKGAQLATLDKAQFFLSGPGYYSGDTHTHSLYSDGKSTLAENRASMIAKGHSFLYSTDHNTLEHEAEINAFHKTEEAEDFLQITGYEYTTMNGHALAYGSKDVYDPTKMTEKGNLQQWQTYVDEMRKSDHLVFLAHPYEAPKYEFGYDLLMNIKDITGIEVWNGLNHHALSYQNRFAFEAWDAMNIKGDAHYIGNAASDVHTKEKQGNPFIKGYFSRLDEDGMHSLLRSGKFFGSNGPEIEFHIDNASIGETLYADEEPSLKRFNFAVFDPAGGIESVVLYKGVVQKDFNPKAKNKAMKVLEIFPQSDAEKRYVERAFYKEVSAGEFYRIEVVTEFGIVAYDAEKLAQDKGFAFSNPIWVEGY